MRIAFCDQKSKTACHRFDKRKMHDTRIAENCRSQICTILASPEILAITKRPGFTSTFQKLHGCKTYSSRNINRALKFSKAIKSSKCFTNVKGRFGGGGVTSSSSLESAVKSTTSHSLSFGFSEMRTNYPQMRTDGKIQIKKLQKYRKRSNFCLEMLRATTGEFSVK